MIALVAVIAFIVVGVNVVALALVINENKLQILLLIIKFAIYSHLSQEQEQLHSPPQQ